LKFASFGWLKFKFRKIFTKVQVSNKTEWFSNKKTDNKELAKISAEGMVF
jgi:hypothetical protein